MSGYINGLRVLIAVCLFGAFWMMFAWMTSESLVRRIMQRTFESMDAAARQRVRENRKLLTMLEERTGFWYHVEQRLMYSGLAGKFVWMTPEMWILCNLLVCAVGYFTALLISRRLVIALAVLVGIEMLIYMWINILIHRNYKLVNDNLIKFLDFLGNYSITAGEVTGIFSQISKYLDEPLRSVLDACYYEAQTSGDVSLALLSMAEKIEHPRFKELVRNMEVSVRYSADFTALVHNSRRAVREHLRTRQERKALVNEALINILILAGMSVVILIMVEQLIGTSIKQILFYSLPGRISLVAIVGILTFLFFKIRRLER